MKTIAVHSDSLGDDEKMHQGSLVYKAKKLLGPSKKGKLIKAKSTTKEMRIFLVDDDMFYLKALEHSISSKFDSADIRLFQTGEACLEQMNLKPEIVILDYYLNSNEANAKDGLTILKEIKKISPNTKVIMLSAQDSLDIAVKCAESGSFDFIAKGTAAFTNINKELESIIEEIEVNDQTIKPYQIIGIIVIIIVIIALLLR